MVQWQKSFWAIAEFLMHDCLPGKYIFSGEVFHFSTYIHMFYVYFSMYTM